MKIKTDTGEEITVEFADGFFEEFDGTTEEMEKVLQMLSDKIKDGSLFADSVPFSVEDLDEDEAEAIMNRLNDKRTKQMLQ